MNKTREQCAVLVNKTNHRPTRPNGCLWSRGVLTLPYKVMIVNYLLILLELFRLLGRLLTICLFLPHAAITGFISHQRKKKSNLLIFVLNSLIDL